MQQTKMRLPSTANGPNIQSQHAGTNNYPKSATPQPTRRPKPLRLSTVLQAEQTPPSQSTLKSPALFKKPVAQHLSQPPYPQYADSEVPVRTNENTDAGFVLPDRGQPKQPTDSTHEHQDGAPCELSAPMPRAAGSKQQATVDINKVHSRPRVNADVDTSDGAQRRIPTRASLAGGNVGDIALVSQGVPRGKDTMGTPSQPRAADIAFSPINVSFRWRKMAPANRHAMSFSPDGTRSKRQAGLDGQQNDAGMADTGSNVAGSTRSERQRPTAARSVDTYTISSGCSQEGSGANPAPGLVQFHSKFVTEAQGASAEQSQHQQFGIAPHCSTEHNTAVGFGVRNNAPPSSTLDSTESSQSAASSSIRTSQGSIPPQASQDFKDQHEAVSSTCEHTQGVADGEGTKDSDVSVRGPLTVAAVLGAVVTAVQQHPSEQIPLSTCAHLLTWLRDAMQGECDPPRQLMMSSFSYRDPDSLPTAIAVAVRQLLPSVVAHAERGGDPLLLASAYWALGDIGLGDDASYSNTHLYNLLMELERVAKCERASAEEPTTSAGGVVLSVGGVMTSAGATAALGALARVKARVTRVSRAYKAQHRSEVKRLRGGVEKTTAVVISRWVANINTCSTGNAGACVMAMVRLGVQAAPVYRLAIARAGVAQSLELRDYQPLLRGLALSKKVGYKSQGQFFSPRDLCQSLARALENARAGEREALSAAVMVNDFVQQMNERQMYGNGRLDVRVERVVRRGIDIFVAGVRQGGVARLRQEAWMEGLERIVIAVSRVKMFDERVAKMVVATANEWLRQETFARRLPILINFLNNYGPLNAAFACRLFDMAWQALDLRPQSSFASQQLRGSSQQHPGSFHPDSSQVPASRRLAASSQAAEGGGEFVRIDRKTMQAVFHAAAIHRAWGEEEWLLVQEWLAQQHTSDIAYLSWIPHMIVSHTCGVPLLRGEALDAAKSEQAEFKARSMTRMSDTQVLLSSAVAKLAGTYGLEVVDEAVLEGLEVAVDVLLRPTMGSTWGGQGRYEGSGVVKQIQHMTVLQMDGPYHFFRDSYGWQRRIFQDGWVNTVLRDKGYQVINVFYGDFHSVMDNNRSSEEFVREHVFDAMVRWQEATANEGGMDVGME